jgi:predicted AAA+ superfamily ATPase
MYTRSNYKKIEEELFKGRAVLLLGARQVGKTTLLKQLIEDKEDVLWLNADEVSVRNLFENLSIQKIKQIIGSHKILVIDEAQLITDIGRCIKLIVDNVKNVQVLATGSSAFELKSKLNEPLTGRKWEHPLFPLSVSEIASKNGSFSEQQIIEQRLLYGSYPEVVNEPANAQRIITELSESYLYKDLFMWGGLKKPDKIITLLKALAYQVGSQVSFYELSQIVQLDKETIEKYVEILEQCYIIFRLNSFNKNLRNELKKSRKIYFFDNGIRNALIQDFRQIANRQDVGALWENYIVSEIWKKKKYENYYSRLYFWRTQTQQEIDIVFEENAEMTAIEIKWNPKVKTKFNALFLEAYKPKETIIIHPENYIDYLLKE